MRRAEDPATLGDLHQAMSVVIPVLDRILAAEDARRGPRRPRLEVIAGTAKRRTKPRGKLHLVAS